MPTLRFLLFQVPIHLSAHSDSFPDVGFMISEHSLKPSLELFPERCAGRIVYFFFLFFCWFSGPVVPSPPCLWFTLHFSLPRISLYLACCRCVHCSTLHFAPPCLWFTLHFSLPCMLPLCSLLHLAFGLPCISLYFACRRCVHCIIPYPLALCPTLSLCHLFTPPSSFVSCISPPQTSTMPCHT